MDVVSLETAKQLKDAGFPQPEPRILQIWYSIRGRKLVLLSIRSCESAGMMEVGGDWSDFFDLEMFDEMYFAPTADDVLRQIPGADLRWNGSEYQSKYAGKEYDINSAECAAKMWFKKFQL